MTQTNGNKNFLLKLLTGGGVSTAIAILGVASTLFSIVLTSKLAPVVESIGRLDSRVEAVEQEQKDRAPQYQLIPVIANKIDNIEKNVSDTKKEVQYVNEKLDKILFK